MREKRDVADLQATGAVLVGNAKVTESAQVDSFYSFFVLTEQWLNTYRSTFVLVPRSSKTCGIEYISFGDAPMLTAAQTLIVILSYKLFSCWISCFIFLVSRIPR